MKVESGDILLIDRERAEEHDSDFGQFQEDEMKVRVETPYMPARGNHWVRDFNNEFSIGFYLPENAIIENLSNPQYVCEEHRFEGLWHDKYSMRFCPWCGIETGKKIKRHPQTRRVTEYIQERKPEIPVKEILLPIRTSDPIDLIAVFMFLMVVSLWTFFLVVLI